MRRSGYILPVDSRAAAPPPMRSGYIYFIETHDVFQINLLVVRDKRFEILNKLCIGDTDARSKRLNDKKTCIGDTEQVAAF